MFVCNLLYYSDQRREYDIRLWLMQTGFVSRRWLFGFWENKKKDRIPSFLGQRRYIWRTRVRVGHAKTPSAVRNRKERAEKVYLSTISKL